MSSVCTPRPHVSPVRAAFRAVKTVDQISWGDFARRGEVTIHRGNERKTYSVTPISTDLGGAAFRFIKRDGCGTTYDLLVNGTESSCTCDGFCWTGGCCHLTAVNMLLEDGVLQVAPGSAASDQDDYSDCPF